MQKNREFLNCFWDLAVNDAELRIQASNSLLLLLSKSESIVEDSDYTTKRLVRGLSSSRESARQGFSSCLTELMFTDRTSVKDIITAINESTKVAGSLKKGEERDLMLGKLFGCLVLVKSGKLSKKDDVEFVAKCLLQLHAWKAWMKELVSEIVLLMIDRISPALVVEVLLPLVKDWLNGIEVSELAAWQILLIAGLEQITASKPILKREFASMLPTESLCRAHMFALLAPTLSIATAGYPKIHRVWTNLLGYLFPLTADRELIKQRSTLLNSQQGEFLRALLGFIDKHLIVNSHEKRGVGFHLLVQLVEHCPTLLLPVCLSKRITRSIFSARVNRKHTLHNVSSSVLKAIVLVAGDDNEVRLSVSSILIQNCGANFDSLTKTNTIQALLEDLSEADILRHVESLFKLIGNSYTKLQSISKPTATLRIKKSTKKMEPSSGQDTDAKVEEEEEEEEEKEEEEEVNDELTAAVASIHAIIDNLVSLSKNNKVSERSRISVITAAVLARIVYFRSGHVASILNAGDAGSKQKKLKSSKKDKSLTATPSLDSPCAQVFGEASPENEELFDQVLRCVGLVEGDSDTQGPFPTEVTGYASTRLLSLLSEMGRANVQDSSTNNEPSTNKRSERSSGVDPLQSLANFIELLHQKGYSLLLSGSDDEEDDEAVEDANEALKLFFVSQHKLKLSLQSSSTGGDKQASGKVKLLDSLLAFLNLAVFYSLSSEVIGTEVLEDISGITNEILAISDLSIVPSDPEEDAEASWQSRLFDSCMEFLSVSEGQSVKGIRDAIRKLWHNIADSIAVDLQVIDALVAIISNEQENVGEDEDDIQFDDEDAIEDDDEDEEDDEDEDEEDDDKDNLEKHTVKPVKNSKHLASDSANDEVDINEGDMFRLLSEEDDDEELRGMLQHGGTPEQDAALANLIEMKKAGRKSGLLLAQKRQLLVRTRAVDILEVLLSPKQDATVVLALVLPLVRTVQQLNTDATTMTLQEARGFEQRVREILEEKICKGKHQTTASALPSDDTIELVTELFVCLRSPTPVLKQIASSCLFRITKICTQAPEKTVLQEKLLDALLEFKTKKKSKVPRKFFEDYFVRFPDFALETLANSMMSGCADAKSPYLQTECCELISAVLRRFKTLSVTSQVALFGKFPTFLQSLSQSAQVLVTTRSEGGGSGTNAVVAGKRLKVFLACVKDVLSIIKQKVKLSSEAADIEPSLVASLNSLQVLIDGISAPLQSDLKNGLSASLNVLCSQSKQLIGEIVPQTGGGSKRKQAAGVGEHDGKAKQSKVKKSKQAIK